MGKALVHEEIDLLLSRIEDILSWNDTLDEQVSIFCESLLQLFYWQIVRRWSKKANLLSGDATTILPKTFGQTIFDFTAEKWWCNWVLYCSHAGCFVQDGDLTKYEGGRPFLSLLCVRVTAANC